MVRGYVYTCCRFCGTQEQKAKAAKTAAKIKARQEKKQEKERKRQKSADSTQPDTPAAQLGEGLSLHTHTPVNIHPQKRFQIRHKVPYTSQYMNESLTHDYTVNVDVNTKTHACVQTDDGHASAKGRHDVFEDGHGLYHSRYASSHIYLSIPV